MIQQWTELTNPLEPDLIKLEIERTASSINSLLGNVCYAATDCSSTIPRLDVLPGILTSIESSLEGHCCISQICDDPTSHDHKTLCHTYVDRDLVRSGGSLVADDDLVARKIIVKQGNSGKHALVRPLMMTNKGLVLCDVSHMAGVKLSVWAMPPLPKVNLITGSITFVDRELEFADRSEALKQNKRSFSTENSFDSMLLGRLPVSALRNNRIAVQGFWSQRNWSYQDVSGVWIRCDRVEHNVEYQSIARIEEAIRS